MRFVEARKSKEKEIERDQEIDKNCSVLQKFWGSKPGRKEEDKREKNRELRREKGFDLQRIAKRR
jgi:hypothetical protein